MKMPKIDVKGIAIKTACLGGGAYASVKLNKISFIASQKPALRGVIKIALGAFGPLLMGKAKKGADYVTNVGDGFIAGGALDLASAFDKDFPALAGIGASGDTMGEIIFDESYTSGLGATGDTMGSMEDSVVFE